MKVWHTLSLLAFVFLTFTSAKKNRKKVAAPVWRPSSMPFQNKRFEARPEGDNLKFDCKAQGHPKPNVQWLKDGVRIRNKNSPKMEAKKYGLTLSDLTMDMSGNYTCVVKNKRGQLEWTFVLEVQTQVWPLVVDGPHNITQIVGSDVVFTCRVLNDPSATIRWQRYEPKANKPSVDDFLPDGEDPQMLRLRNIQKEDEGEYRCMAGNINGLKYSSAWLQVVEPAIVPNVPTASSGRNNKNNNNIWSYEDKDDESSLVNHEDQFNFDQDRFYITTTRRPRKNGRRNNGKRKNKKNRKKTPKPIMPETSSISSTTLTTFYPLESSSVIEETNKPTLSPTIWRYDNDDAYESFPDTRYKPNPAIEETEKKLKPSNPSGVEGNLGNSKSKGDISAWKIYTIVGATGGVILLIGLVAITIAICCPKQEGGVYKSTPV